MAPSPTEDATRFTEQPTMTRLENLPRPVALKRMTAAMVDLFCDSFDPVPRRIVLDIDDTEDRAYGQQQLSLFNAHHSSKSLSISKNYVTIREAACASSGEQKMSAVWIHHEIP